MDNWAGNGARYLVLSLPLTTALIFSSAFSPSFAAPKDAIFTLTAFVLAALALISSPTERLKREERPFWIAVGTHVAVTAVSAMKSGAFIGVQYLLFLMSGILILVASRAAMSGIRRISNTCNLQIAISAAASLVALVTVAQFFAMKVLGVFGLDSDAIGRMRMYATLGNPDFVSSFLAVSIPAAIGLAIVMPRWRVFWIAASVLIGLAIVLTGSRAGIAAMAVGATIVASTAMQKKALVMVGAAAACALVAGTQLNSRTVAESLRGRILIWQVSLSGGAAQSAVGSGPGTFAYDYPGRLGQYFTEPGHEPDLKFAGHERHAQNDFIEAWHDTGWLGLGFLLAVFGTWFALAIQKARRSDEHGRTSICVAIVSVSALCAASLFDFPMHRAETWALLWLWMAVPLVSPSSSPARPRRVAWLTYAGAASLLVAGSFFACVPLVSSYELAKGISDENSGRLESSERAYRSALRWEPWSPDANMNLARVIAKSGDYPRALTQSRNATRYIHEPELYILRSRIFENAGRNREAQCELERAMRLFPYSMDLRDQVAAFPADASGGEQNRP